MLYKRNQITLLDSKTANACSETPFSTQTPFPIRLKGLTSRLYHASANHNSGKVTDQSTYRTAALVVKYTKRLILLSLQQPGRRNQRGFAIWKVASERTVRWQSWNSLLCGTRLIRFLFPPTLLLFLASVQHPFCVCSLLRSYSNLPLLQHLFLSFVYFP